MPQLSKTIIACNAIDAKPEVVDVTPQDVKALKETQKALTDCPMLADLFSSVGASFARA